MGSSLTVGRQCAFWIVIALVILLVSPAAAMPWVGATGIAGLVFFLVVSLWRHAQVKRLTLEIDEVLHNGRRVDFSTSREGDIAVLSNELAKMVARLARTTEQLEVERNALSDALADISHQIRTPLTAITLMLPAIERTDDAAECKAALRKLEQMIDRVSWLVTTLLKIAKIDAGAMHVERKRVLCATVVERALAPLESALDLHDIRLEMQLDDAAAFQGDLLWTAEAVENIVKNCMEHTPSGGHIEVRAVEDPLATTIEIADTGSGIAPEDLPHVFERFYRGREEVMAADLAAGSVAGSESSVGPTSEAFGSAPVKVKGFGIGLSLAQALISAQGGTIRAANAPRRGAVFTIAFPKMVV